MRPARSVWMPSSNGRWLSWMLMRYLKDTGVAWYRVASPGCHAPPARLRHNRPAPAGILPRPHITEEFMKNRLMRHLALAAMLSGCAVTAQAQVVISQVYGGGGNSGATLRSDFIELRNNGATAVDLTGWSV